MTKWDDLSEFKDNVYKNETSFDYDEWNDKEAVLTFTNVAWNADYDHIVDWTTDKERDAYFENLDNTYVLKTSWNFKNLEQFNARSGKHIGSIRVDEPYESMIKFNYVKVDLYSQPVPGEGKRKEIFYYFISPASVKLAGNTVELELELDSWTTYKNSLNITGMKLQRGHYAHARTPASKFLKNPLDNQFGILTHEPTLPSVKPLISNEKLVSFQKNSPRVCIALTADLSKPDNLWLNVSDVSNVSRDKDKPLPGANWWRNKMGGDNTKSYLGSNGSAPIAAVGNSYLNGNIPSMRIYSMAPSSFNSFIDFLRNRFPQVIQTIQGVFLLDSALISEGAEIDFYNYKLKPVIQQNSYKIIDEFKPVKSDFGYKAEYADFAKLYTTQFAILEVSNLQGQIAEVSIEDIAEGLEFYSRSSAAFPFLKLEAFINGIGGSDKKTYAVKPWNNANAQLFKSSWEDFKFDIDIPVYGVFAEAAEIVGAQANAEVYKSINEAIKNFENNKNLIKTDENNKNSDIDKVFNNTRDTIANTYTNTTADINKVFENRLNEINNVFSNSTSRIKKDSVVRNLDLNNTYNNVSLDIDRIYDNTLDEIVRLNSNTLATNEMEYDNADDENEITIRNINTTFTNRNAELDNLEYTTNRGITRDQNIYTEWDRLYSQYLLDVNRREFFGEQALMDNASEAYNATQKISKMISYSNLRQQDFMKDLAMTTATMNQVGNTVNSVLGLSPSAFNTAAVQATIDKTTAQNLLVINSQTLVDTHNLLNGGSSNFSNDHLPGVDVSSNIKGEWFQSMGNRGEIHIGGPFRISEKIDTTINVDGASFNYYGKSRDAINLTASERARWTEKGTQLGNLYNSYIRETRTSENQLLESVSYTTDALNANLSTERTIATRVKNTDTDNATIRLTQIAMRTKAVNDNNSNEQYLTSHGVNHRTRTVSNNIADNSRRNDISIDSEIKKSEEYIAKNILDTDTANNERSKTVDAAIAERNKNVNNSINTRIQSVEKAINKAKADTDRAVNTRDYNTKTLKAGADYLEAVSGDPIQYSSNAGKAWIDAWGHRGIDIRVKRCSTATEETAGRTFYKYGYYVDDLWIEEPEFSLMKYFTYWQADDMWISSAEVNETNKMIISNIFKKGCTVWRKPEYVRNVKITENKTQ